VAGETQGNIGGNIEGYAGPTLAGRYPAGSLLVSLQHLKNFYQRWLPALTSRYKTLVAPAPYQHPTNGRLAFIFPEKKEGVNAVNNLVGAVWVGIKNLEVAIDPNHGSTAISDFAWNIEGRVAVVHCHGSHGKPVLYSKRLPQPLPLWHAISCRSFKLMASIADCFFCR